MKRTTILLLIFVLKSSLPLFSQQQASLTIINKSDKTLTTKVIKGGQKKGILIQTVIVLPKGEEKTYFSETGRYFTKSMGILFAKDTSKKNDTIYSKGIPFDVIADKRRGYSNITMKYTVKESKKSIEEGTIAITRKEYLED
jgi:hypothetical protein